MNRRAVLTLLVSLPLIRAIDWARPALLTAPSVPAGRALVVAATGSDLLGDGTPTRPLQTIAEALRRCDPGGVIYLVPATAPARAVAPL